MKIQLEENFEKIVGTDNLLKAWREFLEGKRGKRDVQDFSSHLMDNLFLLHNDLVYHTYRHGGYQAFNICDPKPRNIHKASVRDRLLHHAMHRVLYPFFDRTFITDSYSCRVEKGTHKALNRFRSFAYRASKNNTRTVWVLKCDIRKFFANIDHAVLMKILSAYISDQDILALLNEVIGSFVAMKPDRGLPLGNLTSQLFSNIYMNELDQFVKHKLVAKYYIRYADDFVILSHDKKWLEAALLKINKFLGDKLHLQLHPDKVSIQTVASGVDFLGWVHFPDHRVLRTATKRRMFHRIREKSGKPKTVQSYLGLLSHGNTKKLKQKVVEMPGMIDTEYVVE